MPQNAECREKTTRFIALNGNPYLLPSVDIEKQYEPSPKGGFLKLRLTIYLLFHIILHHNFKLPTQHSELTCTSYPATPNHRAPRNSHPAPLHSCLIASIGFILTAFLAGR